MLPDRNDGGEDLFDPKGLEDKLDLQLDSIGDLMSSTMFGSKEDKEDKKASVDGFEKENNSEVAVDDDVSSLKVTVDERERQAAYHALPSSRNDRIPKQTVRSTESGDGSIGGGDAARLLGEEYEHVSGSQIRRSAANILNRTIG